MIAKIVNFAILVGVLVYFLRAPLAGYMTGRIAKVREDLVTAAQTRETASRQLAEIETKLKALPGELDALKRRGAADIVAERARIEEAAAAERQRLLEHTRREIDMRHAGRAARAARAHREPCGRRRRGADQDVDHDGRPVADDRSLCDAAGAGGAAVTSGAAAGRYARALFDVVLKEGGNLEQVQADFQQFVDVFAQHPSLPARSATRRFPRRRSRAWPRR